VPELVGREEQQAAIDRLLDAARRGDSGALVVRGDAGIGKSALLDHAVGSATAAGMRVVRGVGIESEAELPFGALHLLLHPFLDRLDHLPRPQAAALRVAFGLADGPVPSRFLVGAGTLGLLAELSADEPLLCVVDDAQWLDQSSSDALLFAARRFQVDPLVVLFAARNVAVPFAAPGIASLEVTGLPAPAAAGLLDARAPGLAAPLRDRVLAEAGGNPLAIIELGISRRAAQDDGTFDPAEQVAPPLRVTWRVQETFRTQIAGLPEGTRLALEVAAADSAARLDVIVRAMAAVGASPGDLEPAERARLVSLSPEGLAFRHPLIRAAAYQHAPHHRRVAVHRAFADAETDTDRRAWHLAAATTAPDESVAGELERTAERAEARGGVMAVSAAYDRAARLSTDPELKAVRLVKAAHAAYAAGHPDRAERLATEAESLSGDRRVLADAVFLRAQVRYERAGPSADAALALQAADLVPDDDPGSAALILIEAACAAKDASDLGLLGQAVERLRRLRVPDGSDEALANAAMIAWADVLDGRPERAVAPVGAMLRVARERPLGDLHRVVAGFSALLMADDEAAVAVMSALADDARAHGKLTWIPYALELLTLGHVLRGDFAAAQTCLGEGVPLAEELGMTTQTAILRSIAAWLAAIQGDEDRCRSLAADVLPVVDGRHPGSAALVTWGQGLLDLAAGRFDAALDRLDEVCRGAAGRDLPIRAVADLVEAAVRAGRPDRVQDAAADLERWAESAATPTARALALRRRALLSDQDGDRDGAEGDAAGGLLAEAVERCASPYDRARTQLLWGEWLRRRRRRTEAGAQLEAATEGFEKLGADRWARRARAELAALGDRPLARPHAADLATRLTPQELQVVRLAAAGLTNKEIAARMYLSPRTIGHHLSNVFPKLGVSRRTELAALDL
jgi:DNA-binding CsgD family transcriptional regulator